MDIIKTTHSRINDVDFDNLGFGNVFSDHIFSLTYQDGKWGSPQIVPFGQFSIAPSLISLHYGQMVFEGFKAFCAKSGSAHIFRPDKHHERLNKSCQRLCIPEIDYETFINGLETLLNVDRNWIPSQRGGALYIRPIVFATDSSINVYPSHTYRLIIMTSPVQDIFDRSAPIKLMTPGKYVRAVVGGLGEAKTPANYAASLLPLQEARQQGYTQILWLDGVERKYIEEAGVMNIIFLIDDELITPPINGTILPGVTRDSVIQLAKAWNLNVSERKISIDEVLLASQEGRLQEAIAVGTAAVVLAVGEIRHQDYSMIINDGKFGPLSQKLYDEIAGIHYGEIADKFGWCHPI